MARASEEPIKLPPKIWTALDYAVTVTAHWTSDGRVYLDFLDPYCSVVESAFRAILTSVDGPGQIGFLGYFVEEEQVDRLLEAFEKSPGAAQLIGKKLAMAYYYDNRMPEPLRSLTYRLLSGQQAFTRPKAVKPDLKHRDFLLAGLTDEIGRRFNIALGRNEALLGESSGRPFTSSALVAAALNACGNRVTIELAAKLAYRNTSVVRTAQPPDNFLRPLMAAWGTTEHANPLPSMDVSKKNALLDKAAIWLRKNI